MDQLVSAYDAGSPGLDTLEGLGSLDPYLVQAAFVDRLCAREQTTIAGYKLSFTVQDPPAEGPASSPAYGRLIGAQIHDSGTRLGLAGEPLVETELLLRPRTTVTAGTPLRDLIAALEVRPALEVPVSRFRAWLPPSGPPRLTRAEFIADNCLARALVVGGFWVSAESLDLGEVETCLTGPGNLVARATSAVVMGSPLVAFSWLLETVGSVAAGEVVATGTITTPVRAESGTYRADFGASLGSVFVGFSE
ncbi:MAG: 2-keto-4-pentenoate hydratase [Nocardioides sp.]